MRPKQLKRDFFNRPTLLVSKELLGKFLVSEYRGHKLSGMIVETEAYVGTNDKASHAFKGRRTKRNEVEYGPGGHVYIYLVYGLHYQLNFVTAGIDQPECVLIRAIEPVEGIDVMRKMRKRKGLRELTNGPGKLCQAMGLTRSQNGLDLCKKGVDLYIEDRGTKIPPERIKKGPRIGIDYAGPKWSKVHWRFWIKDDPFVSK
jgi:DNA-3-methyladenine glycosylase